MNPSLTSLEDLKLPLSKVQRHPGRLRTIERGKEGTYRASQRA